MIPLIVKLFQNMTVNLHLLNWILRMCIILLATTSNPIQSHVKMNLLFTNFVLTLFHYIHDGG